MWSVVFHPEAEAELDGLVAVERVAALNAVEKLAALGPTLPFPHQSHLEGGDGTRDFGRGPVEADGECCTTKSATYSWFSLSARKPRSTPAASERR